MNEGAPCIIFDLFGVVFSKGLAGSLDSLQKAFRRHADDVARTYRRWEAPFDLGSMDEAEFWANVNAELGTKCPGPLLTSLVLSGYSLRHDVVRLIRRYRSNHRTVAYSNYRREWYSRLDAVHHISKEFDCVYISSDVGLLKPDPEVFNFVSREQNTTVSNLLLVDDNKANVDAARSAGARAILFEDVYSAEAELHAQLASTSPEYDMAYAGVIVESRDGTLVLQRRHNITEVANPGKLSVFGGRSHRTETAKSCAIRELEEELGLCATEQELKHVTTLACPVENNQWMHCTYFAITGVDLSSIELREGEAIEVFWPEQAVKQEDLTPIAKHALLAFIAIRNGH